MCAALSQLLIGLCHPSSHAILHIITYNYIQVRQLEQLFHIEWSSHLISAIVRSYHLIGSLVFGNNGWFCWGQHTYICSLVPWTARQIKALEYWRRNAHLKALHGGLQMMIHRPEEAHCLEQNQLRVNCSYCGLAYCRSGCSLKWDAKK